MGVMQQFLQSHGYGREALMAPKQEAPDQGMQGLAMMAAMQGRGRGAVRGGAGLPAGGGHDVEIFYGGNKFNPSSVDSKHQNHLHLAMQNGIVKVGKALQKKGFDIGEHPAFGGVDPVHTAGSHHYNRDAIDINYTGGGRWATEAEALNWLERRLRRKYG